MVSIKKATLIVKQNLPNGDIQKFVTYKNLYLFQVFRKALGEEQMDPFYSVDRQTGEFKEFSIITDGNALEITTLFKQTKGK